MKHSPREELRARCVFLCLNCADNASDAQPRWKVAVCTHAKQRTCDKDKQGASNILVSGLICHCTVAVLPTTVTPVMVMLLVGTPRTLLISLMKLLHTQTHTQCKHKNKKNRSYLLKVGVWMLGVALKTTFSNRLRREGEQGLCDVRCAGWQRGRRGNAAQQALTGTRARRHRPCSHDSAARRPP